MNPTRAKQAQAPPKTIAQLLDHEEALAIERVTQSVERLGDESTLVAALRSRIRSHPILASGLGVVAGLVAAPLLVRAGRRLLTAVKFVPGLTSMSAPNVSRVLRSSRAFMKTSR